MVPWQVFPSLPRSLPPYVPPRFPCPPKPPFLSNSNACYAGYYFLFKVRRARVIKSRNRGDLLTTATRG